MGWSPLLCTNRDLNIPNVVAKDASSGNQFRTAPGKNKQTSVRSHRNGTVPEKQIGSSHKKGTAPKQTDCCVISQERDRSLKTKLLCHLTRKGLLLKQTKTPTKLSQQITKCEWISGTLSQHVAWFCDSRFFSQGGSVSPQAWSSSALKGYSNIFLIALETRPVLYNG